jgi:hypothetical protein
MPASLAACVVLLGLQLITLFTCTRLLIYKGSAPKHRKGFATASVTLPTISVPVSLEHRAVPHTVNLDGMSFCYGSEIQLSDELHVAGAAVAEIGIKRIRRTGQTES